MIQKNDQQFNSFSLLQFIWQKRRTLTLVCCIVAIVTLILSFLIHPRFTSTAIIYAPRTNSVAKILLNPETYNERLDMKAYADDAETEQMMEILMSREIKDTLIKRYNLYVHYRIREKELYRQTKMYNRLKKNINIKRTKYGAISVSVEDTDPQMAADMANDIIALLDSVKNRIEHERTMAAYNLLVKQLNIVDEEVRRIDDSVQVLMENGMYDFGSQANRIMQQYAIAVAQGNTAGQRRLEEELVKISTWGPHSITLREEQTAFRTYYTMCKTKLMNALVDIDSEIPMKFVIERAIPSDKKSFPKKSLIVLFSTASAFFLTLLVLLAINKIKSNNLVLEETEENQ